MSIKSFLKRAVAATEGRPNTIGAPPPGTQGQDALSPAAEQGDYNLIAQSQCFDLALYRRTSGLNLELREAILHFIREGSAAGLSPMAAFDPSFYLDCNPDVAGAGINPLVHYLAFGKAEKRFVSRPALDRAVETLDDSGLFDDASYRTGLPGPPSSTLELLKHYLTMGWRSSKRPNPAFDDAFYLATYPDARTSDGPPILHYIAVGRNEERITCYEIVAADVRLISESPLFDETYYRERYGLRYDDTPNAAVHYLIHGGLAWLDPSAEFSSEYYLRKYPDIARHRLNPLVHYLRYGRGEGRRGTASRDGVTIVEANDRDVTKADILVALHECSRTGAPLLGLALIRDLRERYNVHVWTSRPGPLSPDVERLAIAVQYGFTEDVDTDFRLRDIQRRHPLAAAILNSVETGHLADALQRMDIPTVALVHEYADYTLPPGRVASLMLTADRCVFPAQDVADSARRDLAALLGETPQLPTVSIRPQGLLPQDLMKQESVDLPRSVLSRLEGKQVILGAGFIHIRKGVDLFLDIARHALSFSAEPDKLHFLWIGDGYHPKSDINYSVWLGAAVERMKLRDHVTFLDSQPSLTPAFDITDLFLLPSRLDPFPNVVVDALSADVPVVCFEHATGCAEFLKEHDAFGAVVPYLDTMAAAKAILELLAAPVDANRRSNLSIVSANLSHTAYVEFLENEMKLAGAFASAKRKHVDVIEASGVFDGRFFGHGWSNAPSARNEIQQYVSWSLRGVHRFAPRPGFNDLRYLDAAGVRAQDGTPALALALAKGSSTPVGTHSCMTVRSSHPPSANASSTDMQVQRLRVAIHIHLFYPDLAAEFKALLDACGIEADLFVSCPDAAAAEAIGFSFRKYRAGAVDIRQVPNLGRDIGPMVSEFASSLRAPEYDLVGHFHGKRSRDMDSVGTGDRWRSFLWTNLLGDFSIWRAVHDAFAGDTKLGVMFAEDRHLIGWTDNLGKAEELSVRLGVELPLPVSPLFPLGTMFWARPAALSKLLDSGLTWSDYPEEPLERDGTILHAIERMIPTIAEDAGFKWATVHVEGTQW